MFAGYSVRKDVQYSPLYELHMTEIHRMCWNDSNMRDIMQQWISIGLRSFVEKFPPPVSVYTLEAKSKLSQPSTQQFIQ